jgi:hypothetical protein
MANDNPLKRKLRAGEACFGMESEVRLSDGFVMAVLSNTEDGAWRVFQMLDEKINAG